MKKGSNVQRSLFSSWLGPSSVRPSSLIVAACWLLAACSGGSIQDRTNPNSGGSDDPGAGGSTSGQPTGGGPQGGRTTNNNQGGQSQGNSGNTGTSGSGNNTSVGGSTGNGGMGSTGDPIPNALPAPSACSSTQSPGPRMLRRLSAAEFNASIYDLFKDKSAPITPVFNDQKVLGFTVDANALTVQGLNADQLMTNAETLAAWAVSTHLSTLSTCTTKDDTCGKQFIKSFGRRAFRMPLSDTQVTSYLGLFSAEANFNDAVTTVVTAMLQSPNFLYRSELGTGGAGSNGALTAYEVASSLSYLLTGSMPDDTLSSATDMIGSGTWSTDALNSQATRLIGTDAGKNAFMNFMSGWLGLDRVQTNVKTDTDFTDAVRADMAAETKGLLLDLFGQSGTVSGIFTSKNFFLNQNLAKIYGLSTNGLGTSVQKTTSVSVRDAGLLAQGSILAGYARSDLSSPTQRGHLVRSRLLCQDVPPPPAGLDTKFQPSNDPTLTTRDHYVKEHATPARTECYGCHKLMDPIGFAFEHYDSVGAWRDKENGQTIDATATIIQANQTDGDKAVNGLTELQAYLATNDDLKRCMIRFWSYYSFGSASWAQDGCTYDAIQTEAAASSYSLQKTLLAITHTKRFTTRSGDQ